MAMTVTEKYSATRRALIAASLAAAALPGCALFRRKAGFPCSESETLSSQGPLTIDSHCHVFNGSDLQVGAFIAKVGKNDNGLRFGATFLGDLLQAIGWDSAPSGQDELRELKVLAQQARTCSAKEVESSIDEYRYKAHSRGVAELKRALEQTDALRVLRNASRAGAGREALDRTTAVRLEAARQIDALSGDLRVYRETQSTRAKSSSADSRSVTGLLAFVLQNLQYRHVSCRDYLQTFNQAGMRTIDLMLPSMVDYDWWLAGGASPPTSLSTQIEVMQQISILTRGRVHAFAAFDPLREVAYQLGKTTAGSFDVVTSAILEKGCVGIKLYPPMGFAAMGNEEIHKSAGYSIWEPANLPAWTRRNDFGKLLDGAMLRMLKWCQSNEVPVMAHTNLSNGASKDLEALAGSEHWKAALTQKGIHRLRINFGHFGDTSADGNQLDRARGFLRLMNNSDGSSDGVLGENAFADAGYFVDVIEKEPVLLDHLITLYDETAAKGGAALANRFLYGTDWEMMITEGNINPYLSRFVDLLSKIEARPSSRANALTRLSDRFFGFNAVNWVGLQKGQKARDRLHSFYAKNGIPAPDWVKKVDVPQPA